MDSSAENARQNAASSFGERLNELRPWLILLARLHLNADHRGRDASDIAQEALVDAVKYRGKIGQLPLAELEHWLRRVVRHKVIDYYRGKQPEITAADLARMEADVGDSFLRIEEMVVDFAVSPSGQVAAQDEQIRLANAIEELPDEYREVVLLRDLAGWPLKEVANHLECSIGVVAGRLRRARSMLFDLLTTPT